MRYKINKGRYSLWQIILSYYYALFCYRVVMKLQVVPETFEWILPELAVLNFTQQFNALVENL